MTDVYVAQLFLRQMFVSAPNIIGTYNSLRAAMDACQSMFDEYIAWQYFESPVTPLFCFGKLEVCKTAWALEMRASEAQFWVTKHKLGALPLRPMTDAEQDAVDEALSEEYAAAMDESEAGGE